MVHVPAHDDGQTTGTERRPGRTLGGSLAHFDLPAELDRLDREPPGNDPDRKTITLAKEDAFRVVLSSLRAGVTIGGDETNGALSLLVLRGAVRISRDGREERLSENELAVIEPGGPWRGYVESDCAILLTAAWPPDAADRSFAF